MSALPDNDETLRAAVEAMRANRPLRAEEICRDFLTVSPGSARHLRLLGHALMKQRRLAEAEEQLRFALSLEPRNPQLHEDLGSALALGERYDEAIPLFETALDIEPRLPLARKKLGQALAAIGRTADADEAFEEYLEADPDKAIVARGVEQLQAEQVQEAIATFREALRQNPDNVDAMRFLANIRLREGKQLGDAEALLRRATQLAPDFTAAWTLLGAVLHERSRHLDSIDCYRRAVELAPDDAQAHGALGNALAHAGFADKAEAAYARAVELKPAAPNLQMGHAHVQKTLGDLPRALAAYRAAIAAKADFGEAYWSMANLKIFEFDDDEFAAMERALEHGDLSTSAEVHFRFSLGKACEDRRDYDRAWHYYDTGNRKQRPEVAHDPVEFEGHCARIIETFSHAFVEEHAGHGFDAPDPIFIVGLPRAGSTLIEQILASHSQVEGTAELPDLGRIAMSIGRYRPDNAKYPESVRDLRTRDWRAYGRQYIEDTRQVRVTDRPYFTDKLPNNFPHVGLLHLILPHAKVINARRHPLDSCLGAYKQLFGKGQNFTYDVEDLADYYRQYHAMMQHWHAVLPGKVLDVHYEETVLDLETQVRRILEHCGLPFEETCLRFHETDRPVKTASSEQVRQPIYRGALGKWRRYESHLDVWRGELADIVDTLPESVRNAGLE